MLRTDNPNPVDLEPGEWMFDDSGMLWARLPEPCCGVWRAEDWTVSGPREAPTVTPSIHADPGDGPPREWHGHLVNGEWKVA